MNIARVQAAALVILEESGWKPGAAIAHDALFGPATPDPALPVGTIIGAKLDAGNGRKRTPMLPTRVYVLRKGYDRKLAAKQSASHGKVLEAIVKAGKAGINGPAIAAKMDMNPKTVQSSAYHLRHAGLVETIAVKG